MCGIAGFWDRHRGDAAALDAVVVSMTDTLRHRGPDDGGTFVDAGAGIALGSRRLAVVDLSPHGHQPMCSADGRYVVAYNGEVYNFADLRAELERAGERFAGGSDTEVLVTAIGRWGVPEAVRRCNGMFAFALWDRRERRLHLARDRFGEKPLYYGWAGGVFVFGSELKALAAHPAVSPELDHGALALYLRHSCVPAPYSVYRGIAKLPPATVLTLAAEDGPGSSPVPRAYWSLRDAAEAGTAERFRGTDDEATEALDEVLGTAVRLRMHADVGLGAFLSGGVDSSLVVALMQAGGGRPVQTFTIASDDPRFDESADARAVARHLGSDHHELPVTATEALEVVPALPTMFDEPFADSSQVPTALLARLTRRHVTVALSGDGGDELFGGYNRYLWAARFWHRIEPVPRPLRRLAGAALGALPPRSVDRALGAAGRLVPPLALRMPGTKVAKVARVLPAADLAETHRLLASDFDDPGRLLPGASEPPTTLSTPEAWPALEDPVEQMMYLDTVTYLPDDILTKVDRATMAFSLEGRMPFLDPAVAAFAWRLPPAMKVRGGTGKWLLRRLLHRYVPPELVERPKAGFGVPLGEWLRGPLRPWAEDLLEPGRLRRQGLLAPGPVQALWREHLSGRRDREYELWDVLVLQAWLDDHRTAP